MDITLHSICKAYGENTVLHDFSHSFPGGRISCILGPSGCGKTTLLRLIAGLERPDSGHIEGVEGKKISAVFQENRLIGELSARKNVLLTARPGFSAADADALLASLGLSEDQKPVKEFSGGMQRRVAIARALAADFELLLLDEPLTGLDGETGKNAAEAIQKQLSGRTCIWITHNPENARTGSHILQM